MRYPRWLPYPSSWFKAFVSFLFVIPLKYIVQFTGESLLVVFGAESVARYWLFEFLLITLVFVPIVVFSYIHCFLWGKFTKAVKWLPNFDSWLEGAANWLISVVSFGLCFYILVRFASNNVYYSHYFTKYGSSLNGQLAWFISSVFIVTAAYLYQLKRFVKESLSISKKH